MPVPQPVDSFDLLQGHWPPENEEKFAASAASLTAKAQQHNVTASEYRSALAGLGEEVFKGYLADTSREKITTLAGCHESEEQFCLKIAGMIANLGRLIFNGKTEIAFLCTSASSKLIQYELDKAKTTKKEEIDRIQKQIDNLKRTTREDIAHHADQLEQSLVSEENEVVRLNKEMNASHDAAGVGGDKASPVSYSAPVPESVAMPHSPDLGGSEGASSGGLGEGAGGVPSSVDPAALMGAMPQAAQAASPLGGGQPGGAGMPAQLPGQDLASKAMDMAQNMNGQNGTLLSDSSVKDLLDAAHDNDMSGSGSSSGDHHGDGSVQGAGMGAGSGGLSNPSLASGPSPAAPVTTPRPGSSPSLAVTELAGSETIAAPVSGLSAAADVGSLTAGPASSIAAASAQGAVGSPAVSGFGEAAAGGASLPAAGTTAIPSTVRPEHATSPAAGGGPVQNGAQGQNGGLGQNAGGQGQQGGLPAPPRPPVLPPPVTAGAAVVPLSTGMAIPHLTDLIAPPVMLPVVAAPPREPWKLPLETQTTINITAWMVTQMREMGWVPSVAAAYVHDGTVGATIIATGDDLSILPADITIPERTILLHQFNLGEEFRRRWSGSADVAVKLIAGIEAYPGLKLSMIKHLCAYSMQREVRELDHNEIPFTPLSMDAAWAIRALYTRPTGVSPAYTQSAETFTAAQIRYVMDTAVRVWRLPTRRLSRDGQAIMESASMFASRWSNDGEAGLKKMPRGYDSRIAGYLWAATREALNGDDLERASWYAQYLRYQTLAQADRLAS